MLRPVSQQLSFTQLTSHLRASFDPPPPPLNFPSFLNNPFFLFFFLLGPRIRDPLLPAWDFVYHYFIQVGTLGVELFHNSSSSSWLVSSRTKSDAMTAYCKNFPILANIAGWLAAERPRFRRLCLPILAQIAGYCSWLVCWRAKRESFDSLLSTFPNNSQYFLILLVISCCPAKHPAVNAFQY